MNLITPDTGLLFWMVVIFGIVFFLLAKFGFPVITGMVEKRSAKIAESLREADEIAARLEQVKQEQERLLSDARREQSDILREASQARERMLAQAREDAEAQSARMLSEARERIAAEKESALRDVRREVALLSVQVAEKVLRHELDDSSSQRAFVESLVDEASSSQLGA